MFSTPEMVFKSSSLFFHHFLEKVEKERRKTGRRKRKRNKIKKLSSKRNNLQVNCICLCSYCCQQSSPKLLHTFLVMFAPKVWCTVKPLFCHCIHNYRIAELDLIPQISPCVYAPNMGMMLCGLLFEIAGFCLHWSLAFCQCCGEGKLNGANLISCCIPLLPQ